MTIAYWCVLVAALLPIVWAGAAKSGIKGYDNARPREFLGSLQGWPARANFAQQNSYEAFPPFAAGVIIAHLCDTPQGTTKDDAARHVRLVMLVNDVTLRNLIPDELAKGFGFFQSKPATAFAPFAVTPDELGPAWKDGRAHLRVRSTYNGEVIGDCDAGPEMHFSFFDLIQHLCKTRAYGAGTIVGSGTVSNEDRARGVSCLAERRMSEIIDSGKPSTPFMKVGDHIRVEALRDPDDDASSVFGRIDQDVVAPGPAA